MTPFKRSLSGLVLLLTVGGCSDIEAPLRRAPGLRALDDAVPGTCAVTSTADDGSTGTLRTLIADVSCTTIDFSVSLPAVITLTSGPLQILHDLSIQGPGATNLSISGSGLFGVVSVGAADGSNPVAASFDGLTILDGNADVGGIVAYASDVTITNSVVRNNTGGDVAGGMEVDGHLVMNNTTVADNSAGQGAGGIWTGASATITNSTVSGNHSSVDVGGIRLGGDADITNTTVSGNSGWQGGIRGGPGTDHLVNTTVSANTGSEQAGGLVDGNVTIAASVIAGNRYTGEGLPLPDCAAVTITSYGFNFLGRATGCDGATIATDLVGADPMLGALADNGGPTLTQLPEPGSPLIDAIPPANCSVTTDQRGQSRPQGAGCDIGAVETAPALRPVPVAMQISSSPAGTAAAGTPVTLSATITDPEPNPPLSPPYISTSTTVSFIDGGSCAAPGSSLGSAAVQDGVASVTTSALTLGSHTVLACYSGNARYLAGEASLTFDVTDATPPVVTPAVTGTLGSNGWYTSNVAITWNVTDPESPATKTGCADATVTADTPAATFTCTATSAGGTTAQTVVVMRDASAPVITFTGATSYTVDQTLAITCSAVDPTSGVATQACPSASGPAYAAGVGSHTLSATATNGAGLTSTSSVTYTVSATVASVSALVNLWVSNGGVANSLTVKLQHNDIGAFINEVNAQSGKKLPADKAALLIQLANAL